MTRLKHYLLGTRIVAAWIAAGVPMVSRFQASERAQVCLKCPMNQKSRTGSIQGWIIRLIIARRISRHWPIYNERQLLTCSACGCNLRHKVRMPIEEIAKGIDLKGGELANFAEPCWIRNELVK